jgi:hypothetical protein
MAWEHHMERPTVTALAGGVTAVRLSRPTSHADRIAVSKSGIFIEGGCFFLDFCRPIQVHRRFGRVRDHVGLVVALLVPVIHENAEFGTHAIAVDRSDPRFEDLCKLWDAYYPACPACPAEEAPASAKSDTWSRSLHFAAQFPYDH